MKPSSNAVELRRIHSRLMEKNQFDRFAPFIKDLAQHIDFWHECNYAEANTLRRLMEVQGGLDEYPRLDVHALVAEDPHHIFNWFDDVATYVQTDLEQWIEEIKQKELELRQTMPTFEQVAIAFGNKGTATEVVAKYIEVEVGEWRSNPQGAKQCAFKVVQFLNDCTIADLIQYAFADLYVETSKDDIAYQELRNGRRPIRQNSMVSTIAHAISRQVENMPHEVDADVEDDTKTASFHVMYDRIMQDYKDIAQKADDMAHFVMHRAQMDAAVRRNLLAAAALNASTWICPPKTDKREVQFFGDGGVEHEDMWRAYPFDDGSAIIINTYDEGKVHFGLSIQHAFELMRHCRGKTQ